MILVTGGAGYIGSHFVKHLTARSDTGVVVLDNLSLGHREALASLPRVYFHQADIKDSDALARILSEHGIDVVVHFAASAYVGESQSDPVKYFDNNVVGSLSLFKAMERHGVRKIVFSSTCSTYGNPEFVPMTEEHPQKPVNVYGLTKLMVEQALRAYSDRLGWSFISLRYFNVAGADEEGAIGESHEPETHLIPLALQAALGRREYLEVYGDDYDTPDGTCIRDYINVNDLARAHMLALQKLEDGVQSEAVNLGTAHGASVKQVVDICETVTGRAVPVKMGPRRPGDPPVLVADYSRAKLVLGWQPERDLEATIRSAWNWEQNRRF